MIKRPALLLLISLLCGFITLKSQPANIQLSDQAEIHIITCGPYQGELYSAFGHSAIRVSDPVNKIEWLYNYGVFDFDQPNFYLNFARGNLNYKLALMDYFRFRNFYIYQNRYIHEQVLNLNQTQKQQLFDFLEWNMLPENQYYLYDYFYDNCATRVRDAIITTFGEAVNFDGSYITTDYTIRDLTDIYLAQQPWGDLGIDICLGLPMDKKATPFMYMFLPDYIESAFNNATIQTDSGTVPLVKNTIITYASKPEPATRALSTPLNVMIAVLLIGIAITYFGFKQNKWKKGIDIVLFLIVGSVGLLLFLLWFATDHKAATGNLNLLWALPLHLPVAFILIKKQLPTWMSAYFKFVAYFNLLLLLTWYFMPQDLHFSLIPLTALIGIRAFYIRWQLKK